MKKRKRSIGIGILLGIIAAAWIHSPYRPKLTRFTTPVMRSTTRHERVRISLLIPADWRLDPYTPSEASQGGPLSERRLVPAETYGWMPKWLRRFFHMQPERNAMIDILLSDQPSADTSKRP